MRDTRQCAFAFDGLHSHIEKAKEDEHVDDSPPRHPLFPREMVGRERWADPELTSTDSTRSDAQLLQKNGEDEESGGSKWPLASGAFRPVVPLCPLLLGHIALKMDDRHTRQ
jgi:hypothetical protein